MWGGDPTLASPHRTRHTRLGAGFLSGKVLPFHPPPRGPALGKGVRHQPKETGRRMGPRGTRSWQARTETEAAREGPPRPRGGGRARREDALVRDGGGGYGEP